MCARYLSTVRLLGMNRYGNDERHRFSAVAAKSSRARHAPAAVVFLHEARYSAR